MSTAAPRSILFAAVCLAGCAPQHEVRTAEFFLQPENAAEYAKALEVCKKSALSQKDQCAFVWKAKAAKDMEEDRASFARALRELRDQDGAEGGVTVVEQAPRNAPVAAPSAPVRSGRETADAELPVGTVPRSRN